MRSFTDVTAADTAAAAALTTDVALLTVSILALSALATVEMRAELADTRSLTLVTSAESTDTAAEIAETLSFRDT